MKDSEFLDPKSVKKQEEQDKEELRLKQRRISDFQKLLKLPEFRRHIWHILSESGIFRASFTLNAMQTAFLEGRRDLGLALIVDLDNADINALIQIRQEFVSEQKSKEAITKKEEE